MKHLSHTKQICYSLLAFLLLSITACHKDHDMVAKPVVTPPSDGGKDTLTIGNSVKLAPSTSIASGLTYSWALNGSNVSTDSTYTFTPTLKGDFSIVYTVSNAGGSSTQIYNIHVYGKYENGFFIANEGNYNSGTGTLSFFHYDTQTIEDSVFLKQNPGKDLGAITTPLEFGTIYNNKIYLLVKYGGPLVQVDAYSLKETGRIASAMGNDFHALLPIDTTKALVSTGDGIFPLNLQTVTLGAEIPNVTGEVDDMISAGNYIFVLSANDGLDILNATDYSIKKTIPGLGVGFAKAMDGSIYAAGGDSLLVKINPSTLDTANVKLPFEINATFGFWHPGSITASTRENTVFIAYNLPYSGATSIYKYVIGNSNSVSAPFINISSGKELYGAGISYDAAKDQVVVTTVQSGYGINYNVNDLDFYNAQTGALVTDKSYSGYYFPAVPFYY